MGWNAENASSGKKNNRRFVFFWRMLPRHTRLDEFIVIRLEKTPQVVNQQCTGIIRVSSI
jgi:hypothetical protein